ncbi:85/88 kDa calcium-independent phospholipase A2 isoform X2 [Cylas formicarius]|uniref:85/88 kDa calcium-independent phospholipase A2 isoform X2 n=1 Tax=Cylas formicarius TaxID=197179 RepID=UPI0029586C78|nr:85/88 kDa calcium-independent phospholipase A2 isoform X2 [Cylas formicarius]
MFALDVILNFLGGNCPCDKVIECRSDTFTLREVDMREDGLVIYLPEKNISNKPINELVLHKPLGETLVHSYSLYRSEDIEECRKKFISLHDKLPPFIEVAKEMFNAQGLQKVCDVLAVHPLWTTAHLAAYFDLYESFGNPKINSLINSSDEKGVSPLQVAIQEHNLKTVRTLVAANSALDHVDHDNNSIFHYAATTTKDIIAILAQSCPPKCLNLRNKNGHNPLHLACLADKPDCVKALLLAGADVNKSADDTTTAGDIGPGYVGNFLQDNPNTLYHDDMKYGGTPLHWARSRQVVEALLEVNCNINVGNFDQSTALHVMVERNRLDCVVTLLSRNANADLPNKDGNRPIHLAVKNGNLPILQALIVFGADLNILNNAGESPRHLITAEQEPKLLYYLHVVGAKRCPPKIAGCTDGCVAGGTYDGIPPPKVIGPANRDILNQLLTAAGIEEASKKLKNGTLPKKGRLLCLDGGGIRGLILVQMLLELETLFQKPVSFCFDWLAGTSTGGILALGIATGKTMKECQNIYFQMKDHTFVGNRPYSSENFENIMKETFGHESVMSDIKHTKVMITGLLADRKPAELHLFRNYTSPNDILRVKHDSPYELPPPPEQQFIWQVARATGAAPTYYRVFQRYLDGGLIANNPTLDAITEIQEHCLALRALGRADEASPVSLVVSLGTGVIPVTKLESVDVYRPERLWDATKLPKLFVGLSNLGTLLVDQATQSDGRVVDRARAWCSMIGVPFFRFSPQISEDIPMDEKSDEKLCNMLWETKAYMHENASTMKELADVLLTNN